MDIVIRDQVMARAPEQSWLLRWAEGVPVTLGDLIRERVLIELDRTADASPGRPLVEGVAGPDRAARDRAVARALDGFRRNAFFVLVDDRQVTELDAEIVVARDTVITFVRLVALKSG